MVSVLSRQVDGFVSLGKTRFFGVAAFESWEYNVNPLFMLRWRKLEKAEKSDAIIYSMNF